MLEYCLAELHLGCSEACSHGQDQASRALVLGMQGGIINLALALLAVQLALTHPAVKKVRALPGICNHNTL